jgi:dihydroorotase
MIAGYLIRGGEVYDGSGAPPAAVDVRVRDGRIAEIGPHLPDQGDEAVDAAGLIVAPGLIDLHAHVYAGMGLYAVDPEQAGLRTGVTTLLDTGTAGALTYPTFHRFVMPQAREEIFALLNISMIGCIQGHPDVPPFMGDLNDARHAHVPSAVACIEQYRDRILGTKVRLTAGLANESLENEQAGLHGAIEAAARTELPCMIHHVRSQIPLEEVLARMRPGDIYTHLYHPGSDGGFPGADHQPLAVMLRARERGVIFDVGHGVGAFSWEVAEPACQQHGFWPDTISTDLHRFNLNGPVFDLPTTMSKFLHLGMPLREIVRATTATPARAMGLAGRLGSLRPGRPADITLLRLETGRWELRDVCGERRTARQRLAAVAVFKRGELVAIERAR